MMVIATATPTMKTAVKTTMATLARMAVDRTPKPKNPRHAQM
jgi:hypothetical protein